MRIYHQFSIVSVTPNTLKLRDNVAQFRIFSVPSPTGRGFAMIDAEAISLPGRNVRLAADVAPTAKNTSSPPIGKDILSHYGMNIGIVPITGQAYPCTHGYRTGGGHDHPDHAGARCR